jgi:hypothetical protein
LVQFRVTNFAPVLQSLSLHLIILPLFCRAPLPTEFVVVEVVLDHSLCRHLELGETVVPVHVNHVGEIPLHPLGVVPGTKSVGSLLPSQIKEVSGVGAYTVIFVGEEVNDWMQ